MTCIIDFVYLKYDITCTVAVRLFRSKLSFRTLYDCAINEAIDFYDFVAQTFYCRRKSFEYALNRQSFSSWNSEN